MPLQYINDVLCLILIWHLTALTVFLIISEASHLKPYSFFVRISSAFEASNTPKTDYSLYDTIENKQREQLSHDCKINCRLNTSKFCSVLCIFFRIWHLFFFVLELDRHHIIFILVSRSNNIYLEYNRK